jgi:two-component system LytT family response regulator
MSLIRTVIIDDEKPARSRVRFFLEEMDNIEIIGEAENGEDGVFLIENEKPQLVILDIQMPKLDGFGLLEKCSYKPAVIFISAYDEYAIHAFEVNAVDYLLKPYTKERFKNALKKVLIHSTESEYWEKKINRLLESYSLENHFLEQVTVKRGNSYKVGEPNPAFSIFSCTYKCSCKSEKDFRSNTLGAG